MISPAAIWILHPDSSWILLICSPPRPITTMRTPTAANHNRTSHSGILTVLLFCFYRVWVRNTATTLKKISTSCMREVHSQHFKHTDTCRIWEMASGFHVRIWAFKRTNAYQSLTGPSTQEFPSPGLLHRYHWNPTGLNMALSKNQRPTSDPHLLRLMWATFMHVMHTSPPTLKPHSGERIWIN